MAYVVLKSQCMSAMLKRTYANLTLEVGVSACQHRLFPTHPCYADICSGFSLLRLLFLFGCTPLGMHTPSFIELTELPRVALIYNKSDESAGHYFDYMRNTSNYIHEKRNNS